MPNEDRLIICAFTRLQAKVVAEALEQLISAHPLTGESSAFLKIGVDEARSALDRVKRNLGKDS